MPQYQLNTRILRKGDAICVSGGPKRRSFYLGGKRLPQNSIVRIFVSLGLRATKHCTKATRLIVVPQGVRGASAHKRGIAKIASLNECIRVKPK